LSQGPVNILENPFESGAQLQTIKCYRLESNRWLLMFDFYPSPRRLVIALGQNGHCQGQVNCELPKGLKPQAHPVQLYLKAHLSNQRVWGATSRKGEWIIDFTPSSSQLRLSWGDQGRNLDVLVKVPGRADYSAQMSLGDLPIIQETAPSAATDGEAAVTANDASPHSETSAVTKSQVDPLAKLRAAVEQDKSEGERQRTQWGAWAKKLQANPLAWTDSSLWQGDELVEIQKMITEQILPPMRREFLRKAQDTIFQKARRAERKIAGALKRLAELEKKTKKVKSVQSDSAKNDGPLQSNVRVKVPKKKPGLWVSLVDDGSLWARVGRSATENAELFRQARDRDLWFHVRSHPGAHVWIARGQAGLGAKEEASEQILNWGAQLAILNCKVRDLPVATVDCTERRHLKSISGKPGHLEILRSTTRDTRRDLEFEKRLKRAKVGTQ
jgi:hypothetical protein